MYSGYEIEFDSASSWNFDNLFASSFHYNGDNSHLFVNAKIHF